MALLAQHKRIEAEATIRRSMSNLKATDDAFVAFDRMKEKIEDKEAIGEAIKQLQAERQQARPAAETTEAVEIELAALKTKLGK